MAPAEADDGRERSDLHRRNLRCLETPLPRGHSRALQRLERGRRQGTVPVPARAWRREACRPRHRPRSRHVLARWQVMSVTFARTDAVPLARIFRGPLVSVLSVAGFLLIWFIAAEIAQSRLLPGPGKV